VHSSVAADHSKAIYAVGTIVHLKNIHLVLDCCQRSFVFTAAVGADAQHKGVAEGVARRCAYAGVLLECTRGGREQYTISRKCWAPCERA
jgi:hypothetical protein